MTQKIAYYHVMVGAPGYMPDSHEFHAWPTRHELARGVSDILDSYGFSQRNRRQINIPEIWQDIQRGARGVDFLIRGNMGNTLNVEFRQIEAREYHAAERESDF